MISTSGIYNPLEIAGCGAWYDAFDLSTLTLSPFNQVTQWNDKSGNGFDLSQATAAAQPTYTTTGINGRPAVLFALQSGSTTNFTQLSTASNSLSNGVPGITVFAVYSTSNKTGASGLGSFLFVGGEAFNSFHGNYLYSLACALTVGASFSGTGDFTAVGRRDGSTNAVGRHGGTITNNVPVIHTGVFDYANAILNQYGDGGSAGTLNPFSNAGTAAAVNTALQLGALTSGSSPNPPIFGLLGPIGEVIVYPRVLTQTEQRRVEWYLARKWNINVV